jgi:pimeloyl-ACP methyl ester carboxylesterase
VNFTLLTLEDFVIDAVSAMQFLASQPSVDGSNLVVMGHSQGCTVAPLAALRVPAVTKVVLLEGIGRNIADVMIRQFQVTVVDETKLSTGSFCNPSDPTQAAIAKQSAKNLPIANATVEAAIKYFPLIRQGYFPPHTQICFGGCATAAFWNSWFNATDPSAKHDTISALAARGVRLLSTNSPTDLNVQPIDYKNMVALVQDVGGKAVIFDTPGLTHWLTPADVSSGSVTKEVFDTLDAWLT